MINRTEEKATLADGHRERLRSRFMQAPLRALPDYEILEMFLYRAIPRADTKPLAKALLAKYGSLISVVNAEPAELRKIEGVGEAVIFQLRLFKDFFSRLHLPVDKKTNILSSWLDVINYCNLTMGFNKFESFRAFYLNNKNHLLADELCESGTVDKVQVYPREILKKAIEHGASAVILVHNHPSGDCRPSESDVKITKTIQQALGNLNIALHDHLIISEHAHFSFRREGLLN
jgi:DNA repair protein RadC